MLQKKICMLGATSVGKTSLVQRFVQSIYSEKYHSTLGVKIDKKEVKLKDESVMLLLWDVQGEDNEFRIRPAFLRGASGYLLVADVMRQETLEIAKSIKEMVETNVGKVPFVLVLNKMDLLENKDLSALDLSFASPDSIKKTSAKTGENVEAAFRFLTEKMLA